MLRCLSFAFFVLSGIALADPPLHPSERFKYGSWAREKAEFQGHALKVLAAQLKLQTDHKLAAPGRVFHQKQHGCLTGKIIVRDKAPEKLRQGIFAKAAKKEYDVLVRFSNGVGHPQHDLKPDVKGVAVKIFGVEDEANPDLEVLDLLMTNAPNPFGADQQEFVEFMEANTDPGFLGKNLAAFAVKHPKAAHQIAKRTLRVVRTVTKENFWSGHPYLHGPKLAVKYNLFPAGRGQEWNNGVFDQALEKSLQAFEGTLNKFADFREWIRRRLEPVTDKVDANYLRKDLAARAKAGQIAFVLSAQLEVDKRRTPVEDALQEWLEADSPSQPLADLVLDKQDSSNHVQDKLCESLRFTPGNFHSEHRPLGNLGRGRIFTYEASQTGRKASSTNPDASIFETLRDLNAVQ